MKKALIVIIATVPVALLAVTAKANPPASVLRPPTQSYLMEQIGCKGGPSQKDRCPYGYRIVGEGRGHCVPAGSKDMDGIGMTSRGGTGSMVITGRGVIDNTKTTKITNQGGTRASPIRPHTSPTPYLVKSSGRLNAASLEGSSYAIAISPKASAAWLDQSCSGPNPTSRASSFFSW